MSAASDKKNERDKIELALGRNNAIFLCTALANS